MGMHKKEWGSPVREKVPVQQVEPSKGKAHTQKVEPQILLLKEALLVKFKLFL